jgi:hypothetical protein
VWGITPSGGTVLVQVWRGGGWHTITSFRRSAHAVFTGAIGLSGRPLLRAQVSGETSLTWQVR